MCMNYILFSGFIQPNNQTSPAEQEVLYSSERSSRERLKGFQKTVESSLCTY